MVMNKDTPPDLTFKVFYSEEDKEYVGLCDQFKSLSWLDSDEEKALAGIKKLAYDILWEEYSFIRPVNLKIDFSKVKSPK
jgi:hypothetical protein